MELVPSTFLALVLVGVILIAGPTRGLWAAFAAAPFGAAAAFNLPVVGGASIGVVDVAALALIGALLLRRDAAAQILGTMRPGQPGFPLILLAGFAVIAAIILPRVFIGETIVFGLARDDNERGITQVLLRPTTGNITQLFRLFLDVVAFVAVATALRRVADPSPVVKAMVVATVVHFALGWIDVASFAAGIPEVMDPIRTANYAMLINHRMVGLKRMIGGFPEASSYGYFTLALFGFWLHYWILVKRSPLGFWMMVASLIVLLRSTSSSAYVSAVLFLFILAALSLATRPARAIERRVASIWVAGLVVLWLGALAIASAYQLDEQVTAYLDRSLFDKLTTQSGIERTSWNAQAFQNFLDTLGMGAGLGSVRASSWFMACLGSMGVIGTALFVLFLWQVVRSPVSPERNERDAVITALKSGCAAMFISAMLTHPTPDLGIFFFMLAGAAAGLSRGGVLESQAITAEDTAQYLSRSGA